MNSLYCFLNCSNTNRQIMVSTENTVEIVDKDNCVHVVRHCGQLEIIEEINAKDYNDELFKKNYLKANKPLVIRDALKIMDFGSAYQHWSLDYLNEKCGDNKVFVRRNTTLDTYKTGKAYQVQEIDFKSYVEDLIENNDRAKNSYLAVQNLKKAFPQIADDLKLASIIEKLHGGPFLWIARPGHYEYTHMDPDNNLLMVFRGQKLVRLYGCNVHSLKPNELGSKGRTIQSQINCYGEVKLDSDSELESFKGTTCSYCLLEEGDLLFFPAFWWHQVSSPKQTISVNVFYGDSGENAYVTKLLASSQRTSFLYWLFNIIEQNRQYSSFNRVLPQLKTALQCFLTKQWHESLTDSQINEIYDEIINYFKFEKSALELPDNATANKYPILKIRGLLWRNNNNKDNDDD